MNALLGRERGNACPATLVDSDVSIPRSEKEGSVEFVNTGRQRKLVDFIWGICNLLRGLYKPNEYHKAILPLTVQRRFDCVLTPTKQAALTAIKQSEGHVDSVRHHLLNTIGWPFYNNSKLHFRSFLEDTNEPASSLVSCIEGC